MKKLLTKKNVLIASGILSMIIFTWDYVGNFQLCGGVWGGCVTTLADIETNLFPIIPIFLFSLITYKLREEVFRAWIAFAYWFVPIWVLLVLLAPSTGSGLVPIDKGRITFGMNIFFCIISLILIARKSFALRGKG